MDFQILLAMAESYGRELILKQYIIARNVCKALDSKFFVRFLMMDLLSYYVFIQPTSYDLFSSDYSKIVLKSGKRYYRIDTTQTHCGIYCDTLARSQAARHISESEAFAIMKNVEMSVEGDILTIKIDLAKSFGPSSTGKTTIVATTEGNVTLPGRSEKMGLNVYRRD